MRSLETKQYRQWRKKKGISNRNLFSQKKLRAGKRRTYFFDVKSTKANDYFLTITESKKRQDDTYERFKIFLYKEDFNKFLESLTETIDHIKKELMPHYDFDEFARRQAEYEKNRENNRIENENSHQEVPDKEETTHEGPAGSTNMPSSSGNDAPVNEDDLKW